MTRRRTTVIRAPRSAVVPPGVVTGPEWVTAQGQASRAATQRYDVRAYGSVGTADDGPTFQAAIDAIQTAGGGVLTGAKQTYAFLTGITLKDGVYLDFPTGTVFDFTGMTTAATVDGFGAAIGGAGTLAALPALSAAVAKDSKTLTFATDPGLVPGDEVVLYNATNSSFSPARTYYRAGEVCRVLSVSGLTVTTTTRRYAAYTTAVAVYKRTPIRTGISGVRIIGARTGTRALRIVRGSDLRLADLEITGSDIAQIELVQAYNARIDNVTLIDQYTGAASNYGLSIVNSQHVYADRLIAETKGAGYVTGGLDSAGSVPNRDLRVANSYLASQETSGGGGGCNLHGNTEYASFANCTMPNGLTVAGDRVRVRGCDISAADNGVIVNSTELLGADFAFVDNDFRATVNESAGTAFCYFQWSLSGLTRQGSTFVWSKNRHHWGAYTAATGSTWGLRLRSNGSLPKENDIAVTDNTFMSTATATGSDFADIYVFATSGSTAFRHVDLSGNVGKWGIRVEGVGPKLLDLSRETYIDSIDQPLDVSWPATPLYTACEIVIDGGTYRRAYKNGMQIVGSTALDTDLFMTNVTSLNNNQSGGAAVTDSSMYLFRFRRVIRRGCAYGDTQGTPTQARADSINTVTTFIDEDNELLGSPTTRYLNAITTHRFRGRGSGAPTLAVADGSRYVNTAGGSGTTFYKREGGGWVAE